MNNNDIHTINGQRYRIVIEQNEIKTVAKVTENYTEVPATKEEIQQIINMLNQKLGNSYSEMEVNRITIDSMVELIIKKIENNEFKSNEDYFEYVKTLHLYDDQEKQIIEKVNEYLRNLMHSPFNEHIESQYKILSDIIHEDRKDNEVLNINFSISNGFIHQTVELFDTATNRVTNLKNQTYTYDTSIKMGLINPVIQELCSMSAPILNSSQPVDIIYSNYYLKFDNRINVNILGCERTYTEELEKLTQKTNTITSDEIKENINHKDQYENMTPEQQLDSDLKDYGSLSTEEQEALKSEKGYTKVRTLKKNNNAHISTIAIFALVIIGLILLVYLGYIILK